ncbi:MAG: helix-turn-helix domain-containing protein [Alphaproteobacteria bacterium]|uniref:Putative antitoxin n=1 Tax=viral metagenome TaxID=1070528 RepID=A0A6M3XIY9_9ZZZZ|nr:helix-turn-helix domain-containing protein [Alphaproteobacteria bacterium]MBU2342220.1 helix-turn-helix domain-containing protein [Alphaproteobacteria bacterium]
METATPREILTPPGALALAVDRIGGQSALGRLVEVSQASVWRWLEKGKPLPAEHVLKVEAATGISRHDLRPDLYPRESFPPPADATLPAGTPTGKASAVPGAPSAHAAHPTHPDAARTCDRGTTLQLGEVLS